MTESERKGTVPEEEPVDPWIAKGVFLAATVALIAIRAPHGQRSRSVPVARSRRGRLEAVLLTIAWVSFLVPVLWVATPFLSFADTPLRPVPLVLGTLVTAAGLVLFHRSHVDLGTNWSITLEVRDGHRLVTEGVYRRVRHPMYAALLLYSAGLALAIPNRLAGLSYFAAMALLFALRLRPEERLMRETFGEAYDAYRARTTRLVPGVW
jgi:protein-S-isoprenylcysteine O-methyltransferase Ste14